MTEYLESIASKTATAVSTEYRNYKRSKKVKGSPQYFNMKETVMSVLHRIAPGLDDEARSRMFQAVIRLMSERAAAVNCTRQIPATTTVTSGDTTQRPARIERTIPCLTWQDVPQHQMTLPGFVPNTSIIALTR